MRTSPSDILPLVSLNQYNWICADEYLIRDRDSEGCHINTQDRIYSDSLYHGRNYQIRAIEESQLLNESLQQRNAE